LLGDDLLFSFDLKDQFQAGDVPYYILLGIFCGLGSVYFIRMIKWIEGLMERINKTIPKALAGGLGLGIIIFIIPPIYGEGYDTIKALLSGNDLMINSPASFFPDLNHSISLSIFLLIIFLIKPVATALTIGAGGSGGVFAPSLFVGGTSGFFFANTINYISGQPILSISNFTLVGMCGVMSGVLHAPLTAIFLIAEITSGYTLFVPLMLVSAIAYTVSSYFESHSLYAKKLIEQGDLIPHDRDKQVLSLIDIRKVVEDDLVKIKHEDKLSTLVEAIKKSKRNIFPVVNDENQLMGIVTLDDVREVIFDKEMQEELAISSIMHKPPAEIDPHENMQSVMSKFEVTGAWNLPVIDNGKYIGFVSKSRIFNTYRKKLIRQTKE